ncbi:UNVERIFIED_CONTAM: hypothetical protein Sradi_2146800 [Sesamum radiatum]|uniref:DUF2470 domain-containing protein n=1 Tax=Sesamum radiatum TaxID=300843 RepID=A0AAW2TL19_SESRA
MATHPDAFWVDFGDFQFLRLEPKVIRYVSGVATALLRSGELSDEEFRAAKVDPIYQFSKPITSHMNKDHAEDTKLIVQHSTSVPVEFAYMLDVDSLGFNVKGREDANNRNASSGQKPSPSQLRKGCLCELTSSRGVLNLAELLSFRCRYMDTAQSIRFSCQERSYVGDGPFM